MLGTNLRPRAAVPKPASATNDLTVISISRRPLLGPSARGGEEKNRVFLETVGDFQIPPSASPTAFSEEEQRLHTSQKESSEEAVDFFFPDLACFQPVESRALEMLDREDSLLSRNTASVFDDIVELEVPHPPHLKTAGPNGRLRLGNIMLQFPVSTEFLEREERRHDNALEQFFSSTFPPVSRVVNDDARCADKNEWEEAEELIEQATLLEVETSVIPFIIGQEVKMPERMQRCNISGLSIKRPAIQEWSSDQDACDAHLFPIMPKVKQRGLSSGKPNKGRKFKGLKTIENIELTREPLNRVRLFSLRPCPMLMSTTSTWKSTESVSSQILACIDDDFDLAKIRLKELDLKPPAVRKPIQAGPAAAIALWALVQKDGVHLRSLREAVHAHLAPVAVGAIRSFFSNKNERLDSETRHAALKNDINSKQLCIPPNTRTTSREFPSTQSHFIMEPIDGNQSEQLVTAPIPILNVLDGLDALLSIPAGQWRHTIDENIAGDIFGQINEIRQKGRPITVPQEFGSHARVEEFVALRHGENVISHPKGRFETLLGVTNSVSFTEWRDALDTMDKGVLVLTSCQPAVRMLVTELIHSFRDAFGAKQIAFYINLDETDVKSHHLSNIRATHESLGTSFDRYLTEKELSKFDFSLDHIACCVIEFQQGPGCQEKLAHFAQSFHANGFRGATIGVSATTTWTSASSDLTALKEKILTTMRLLHADLVHLAGRAISELAPRFFVVDEECPANTPRRAADQILLAAKQQFIERLAEAQIMDRHTAANIAYLTMLIRQFSQEFPAESGARERASKCLESLLCLLTLVKAEELFSQSGSSSTVAEFLQDACEKSKFRDLLCRPLAPIREQISGSDGAFDNILPMEVILPLIERGQTAIVVASEQAALYYEQSLTSRNVTAACVGSRGLPKDFETDVVIILEDATERLLLQSALENGKNVVDTRVIARDLKELDSVSLDRCREVALKLCKGLSLPCSKNVLQQTTESFSIISESLMGKHCSRAQDLENVRMDRAESENLGPMTICCSDKLFDQDVNVILALEASRKLAIVNRFLLDADIVARDDSLAVILHAAGDPPLLIDRIRRLLQRHEEIFVVHWGWPSSQTLARLGVWLQELEMSLESSCGRVGIATASSPEEVADIIDRLCSRSQLQASFGVLTDPPSDIEAFLTALLQKPFAGQLLASCFHALDKASFANFLAHTRTAVQVATAEDDHMKQNMAKKAADDLQLVLAREGEFHPSATIGAGHILKPAHKRSLQVMGLSQDQSEELLRESIRKHPRTHGFAPAPPLRIGMTETSAPRKGRLRQTTLIRQ